MPIALLKELLTQYDAWHQAGGTRASIADPLPWEDEEEEYVKCCASLSIYLLFYRDNRMHSGDEEKNSWEFDTVRARSSTDTQGESINEEVDDGVNRSVVNARIPASLRLLFGEESRGPSKDAFSGFPGTGQLRSRSNTPTVGLGTGAAENSSPIPDRDKPPLRRHGGGGGEHTNDETVRRLDFVFPPRSGQPSRTKSKLTGFVPTSEDEDRQPPSPELERARLPHLGPVHGHGHSHGHGRGIGDATMSTHSVTPHGRVPGNISSSSNDMFPTGSSARSNPSYKDVRTSRGLPNISIPPVNMHGSLDMTFDSPADVTATEEVQQSSTSPSKSNFSMPLFNRKRSQSSATASSSTSPRKLNFPSDFHFPPVASTANIAGPSLPPPISSFNRAKSHNAMSPSHGSLSSSSSDSRSPAAHQTTHSLDNNAIYSNQRLFKPSASSLGPGAGQDPGALSPSYSRANEQLPVSGQPLSRRPSVTRQASVAVMETVHSTAIDIKQDLPSAKIDPDSPVPILGLKDVLKVPALTHEMHGMPDLLPPSPSAASSNRRFFAPTPSSLGSNVFAPDSSTSHAVSSPQLRPPLSPLVPPGSMQVNAPGSPRPDPTDMSTTVSGSGQSTQTSGHKLSSSVSSVSSLGPPLRPLDLGSMMSSHELTHGELARTVDELLQWLSIVETGLTTVLQKTAPTSDAFGGSQAPASVQPFSSVQEEEQESFEDTLYDSANTLNGDNFTDTIDSPLKKSDIIDDDDDDDEAEEGTFEQFLAKMQQRNRIREEQEQEGESSSDGETGAFDHTVRPYEQLAANVTI